MSRAAGAVRSDDARALPRSPAALVFLLSVTLGGALFTAPSCAAPSDGCLGGDDGRCMPPSACKGLKYACENGTLSVRVLDDAGDRLPGEKALATRGDVLLQNDRLTLVLDGIDSAHYLAPSGGGILDLAPNGSSDQLTHVFQSVGILPDDAARYRSVDLIDSSPELVAAVFRGVLDLRPEIEIVTRYELRPCEPGVRIRTDLYHGGIEPLTVFLGDGFFWGQRNVTPFVGARGGGYEYPKLDLERIGDAFRTHPFFAAQSHSESDVAYALLRCDAMDVSGFHNDTISAVGTPRTVLMPGDSLKYERFFVTTSGPGLSKAAAEALDARSRLFGERYVTVRGRTVSAAGTPIGGDERRASLLFYEPAPGSDRYDPAGRRPWALAVPDSNGEFEVRLPQNRAFILERHVLGQLLNAPIDFSTADRATDLGRIELATPGTVSVSVRNSNGEALIAEVILTPVPTAEPAEDAAEARRKACDGEPRELPPGSLHGLLDDAHCVPYLGPSHGPSPACNRVLTGKNGQATFLVPEGRFFIYASQGPFATLARETIEVHADRETVVELAVDTLPTLLPAGVLSADFHVHAAASFDSSFPERDRALTFVATGVDVIAATDHDVVVDYSAALEELGIGHRVRVMPGLETTGHILFLRPPGSEIPKVIGHFNFWPMPFNRDMPNNGALPNQRIEPGVLFDRVHAIWGDGRGVAQLNHPYAGDSFGRDQGYLTAIDYDPRRPIPDQPDDTAGGQLRHRPGGGLSNVDHDVQEVMNGTEVKQFVRYRAGWFSFLNQNIVRAGTANSDSHTLATGILGYPRNLVFGGHSLEDFDPSRFNADVRNGRMVGTNGPVIDACVTDHADSCARPSTHSFKPSQNAEVRVLVRAAPWIPVTEIRFIVSGNVVGTIGAEALRSQPDQLAPVSVLELDSDLLRFDVVVPLAELLAGPKDGWLVIEAGLPLPLSADLDDDGLADTTDNDCNGVVNDSDAPDGFRQPRVLGETDPRFHANVIAPGHFSTAFTNPFLIRFHDGAWVAPGLEP